MSCLGQLDHHDWDYEGANVIYFLSQKEGEPFNESQIFSYLIPNGMWYMVGTCLLHLVIYYTKLDWKPKDMG